MRRQIRALQTGRDNFRSICFIVCLLWVEWTGNGIRTSGEVVSKLVAEWETEARKLVQNLKTSTTYEYDTYLTVHTYYQGRIIRANDVVIYVTWSNFEVGKFANHRCGREEVQSRTMCCNVCDLAVATAIGNQVTGQWNSQPKLWKY